MEERSDKPEPGEAAEVLRAMWAASGQTSADLDELFGPARSCKSMQNVSFDGLAEAGGDLRAAWRATLRRDGKFAGEQASLRELVLGPADPSRPGDR